MMRDPVKRFFQLPGPILSMTLIGIMLLSAVLYYRAVNIQRFLEPALAISTPRFTFAKNVNLLLSKEFGEQHGPGIRFTTNSIFIEKSLFSADDHGGGSGPAALTKLAQVFLSVLRDPAMSEYVDFILIGVRYPAGPDTGMNDAARKQAQQRANLILQSLYQVSPELEENYGRHFSAAALPGTPSGKDITWIEFRFVQSEMLHIEVLKSLKKYVH